MLRRMVGIVALLAMSSLLLGDASARCESPAGSPMNAAMHHSAHTPHRQPVPPGGQTHCNHMMAAACAISCSAPAITAMSAATPPANNERPPLPSGAITIARNLEAPEPPPPRV